MPQPNRLHGLPASVKKQLNARLRRTAYGFHADHLEWLEKLGHKSSQSALGRYSLELRRQDASAAVDRRQLQAWLATVTREIAAIRELLNQLQKASKERAK